MKLFYLAIVVLITGCSVAANPSEYAWGEAVCENNGGVNFLRFEYITGSGVKAYCNNGARFRSHLVEIKEL